MRAIFISYRREDSEGEAGRLFDDLVKEFGETAVFMDVATIEIGRDFRKAIDESVASCGVLLAVIGRNWLDAKNEAGGRRIDNPSDFVRLETAAALNRDIPVVPVLVRGASMPRPDQLPDELKELSYRNGCELTHARWNSDLQLLIKALRVHVQEAKRPDSPAQVDGAAAATVTPPNPIPVPARAPGRKPHWTTFALLGATAVSVAVAGYFLSHRAGTSSGGSSPISTIEVPPLLGMTRSAAEQTIRSQKLKVGNVTGEPKADATRDVVIRVFPAPGSKVSEGTAVDLVISQVPAQLRGDGSGAPAPGNKSSPDFTGPWQVVSDTLNGVQKEVAAGPAISFTQNGDTVQISGRDRRIMPDGTIRYDVFYAQTGGRGAEAQAGGRGHQVATAAEANLVATDVWKIVGDTLISEMTLNYKANYLNHPPGTDIRVVKYRRVSR